MTKHALLSPSAASRWLVCTPSARFEAEFEDKGSEYAAEGSLCHAYAETLLNFGLGKVGKTKHRADVAALKRDPLYSPEMEYYAEGYRDFVFEKYMTTNRQKYGTKMLVEEKLDLREYVPAGFGTADVVLLSNKIMTLIDLKYGKGVEVSSENNKQLMIYALGALAKYEFLYDVETVKLVIYQPRIGNISEWETTVDELQTWAETELKPKAALAYKGAGKHVAGEHCRFCKAKAQCRALAEKNLELAQYEFKDSGKLTDSEISEILSAADAFVNWLSAVQNYAFEEALKGKEWEGFKLVEGRSNRVYTDRETVAKILIDDGVKANDIYLKTLIGITAMQKLLGKARFDALLGKHVIKPAGKPTLVPVSDERPAISGIENAKRDFADVEI